MVNVFNDVKDFHKTFEQPIGEHPHFPNNAERGLRRKLLREEMNEYLDAEDEDNLVEVADALADIIYIAVGTAVHYGIPLEEIWKEVQRSNMAKLHDGRVVKNEWGKILKPKDWTSPDVEGILLKEGFGQGVI